MRQLDVPGREKRLCRLLRSRGINRLCFKIVVTKDDKRTRIPNYLSGFPRVIIWFTKERPASRLQCACVNEQRGTEEFCGARQGDLKEINQLYQKHFTIAKL